MNQLITHTLAPVYDEESRVLILGTMPSPKSRELGFYYGHPQNRFWKVLPALFGEPPLPSIGEKKNFLYRHHLALWDILQSCSIRGADDSSIREPIANDITKLIQTSQIQTIATTGTKAHLLYQKLCEPLTGIQAIALPSTSPANCRTSLEELKQAYSILLPFTA